MIVFFDSNVLIYTVDDAEPLKQQLAITRLASVLGTHRIALSTQVLQEFVNVTTRKLKNRLSLSEVSEHLANFCQFEVVGSHASSVQAALHLMQQHQTSWWDALILEAALRADADLLVSEDFAHGQRFGKLVVENPFLA
jgi:predicted nucleic acid-binding protein